MHRLAGMFGRSALVVKEVHVDEMQECQVKLVARKAGLWSFILALFGIDSTFTLQVYADRIESQEGSLSGRIKTTVPLVALDTYTSGFTKPVYLLVMAGILVLGALYVAFANVTGSGVLALLFILLAGLCVLFFYLRKCEFSQELAGPLKKFIHRLPAFDRRVIELRGPEHRVDRAVRNREAVLNTFVNTESHLHKTFIEDDRYISSRKKDFSRLSGTDQGRAVTDVKVNVLIFFGSLSGHLSSFFV